MDLVDPLAGVRVDAVEDVVWDLNAEGPIRRHCSAQPVEQIHQHGVVTREPARNGVALLLARVELVEPAPLFAEDGHELE